MPISYDDGSEAVSDAEWGGTTAASTYADGSEKVSEDEWDSTPYQNPESQVFDTAQSALTGAPLQEATQPENKESQVFDVTQDTLLSDPDEESDDPEENDGVDWLSRTLVRAHQQQQELDQIEQGTPPEETSFQSERALGRAMEDRNKERGAFDFSILQGKTAEWAASPEGQRVWKQILHAQAMDRSEWEKAKDMFGRIATGVGKSIVHIVRGTKRAVDRAYTLSDEYANVPDSEKTRLQHTLNFLNLPYLKMRKDVIPYHEFMADFYGGLAETLWAGITTVAGGTVGLGEGLVVTGPHGKEKEWGDRIAKSMQHWMHKWGYANAKTDTAKIILKNVGEGFQKLHDYATQQYINPTREQGRTKLAGMMAFGLELILLYGPVAPLKGAGRGVGRGAKAVGRGAKAVVKRLTKKESPVGMVGGVQIFGKVEAKKASAAWFESVTLARKGKEAMGDAAQAEQPVKPIEPEHVRETKDLPDDSPVDVVEPKEPAGMTPFELVPYEGSLLLSPWEVPLSSRIKTLKEEGIHLSTEQRHIAEVYYEGMAATAEIHGFPVPKQVLKEISDAKSKREKPAPKEAKTLELERENLVKESQALHTRQRDVLGSQPKGRAEKKQYQAILDNIRNERMELNRKIEKIERRLDGEPDVRLSQKQLEAKFDKVQKELQKVSTELEKANREGRLPKQTGKKGKFQRGEKPGGTRTARQLKEEKDLLHAQLSELGNELDYRATKQMEADRRKARIDEINKELAEGAKDTGTLHAEEAFALQSKMASKMQELQKVQDTMAQGKGKRPKNQPALQKKEARLKREVDELSTQIDGIAEKMQTMSAKKAEALKAEREYLESGGSLVSNPWKQGGYFTLPSELLALANNMASMIKGGAHGLAILAKVLIGPLINKTTMNVYQIGTKTAMAYPQKFLHHEKGTPGKTFVDLVSEKTGEFHKKLNTILDPLRNRFGHITKKDNRLLWESIHDRTVANARSTPDRIKTAAREISTLLNELRDYANKVGLDVGFIQDYFPRIFKAGKIKRQRQRFESLLRDYFYSEGKSLPEAKRIATEITGRILHEEGAPQLAPKNMQPTNPAVAGFFNPAEHTARKTGKGPRRNPNLEKSRKLGINDTVFHDFLETNVEAVLARYTEGTVKRTEYARIAGPSEGKAMAALAKIIDENYEAGGHWSPDQIRSRFYKMLDVMQGTHARIQTPVARSVNAFLTNAMVPIHMSLVALASLPEFATSIARYGPWHGGKGIILGLMDATHSAFKAADQLVFGKHDTIVGASKHFKPTGKRIIPGLTKRDAKVMLEQLGIIENKFLESAMQKRFTGTSGKWTRRFMKATGLELMTQIQQQMAYYSAMSFIKSRAKGLAKNPNRRSAKTWKMQLERMGIDPAQAANWHRNGMVDGAFTSQLHTAIIREVNTVITKPNPGSTPAWMSNQYLSQVAIFQRFFGAFSNTFVKQTFKDLFGKTNVQTKANVAIGLTTMLSLAALGMYLKDLINGRDPSERYEDQGGAMKLLSLADRAGLTGHLSRPVNFFTRSRYGYKDTTWARLGQQFGPGLGWAVRGVEASASEEPGEAWAHVLSSIMPVMNVTKKTKEMMYDIFENMFD